MVKNIEEVKESTDNLLKFNKQAEQLLERCQSIKSPYSFTVVLTKCVGDTSLRRQLHVQAKGMPVVNLKGKEVYYLGIQNGYIDKQKFDEADLDEKYALIWVELMGLVASLGGHMLALDDHWTSKDFQAHKKQLEYEREDEEYKASGSFAGHDK